MSLACPKNQFMLRWFDDEIANEIQANENQANETLKWIVSIVTLSMEMQIKVTKMKHTWSEWLYRVT